MINVWKTLNVGMKEIGSKLRSIHVEHEIGNRKKKRRKKQKITFRR